LKVAGKMQVPAAGIPGKDWHCQRSEICKNNFAMHGGKTFAGNEHNGGHKASWKTALHRNSQITAPLKT